LITGGCGDALGYNIGVMRECVMLTLFEKLNNSYN